MGLLCGISKFRQGGLRAGEGEAHPGWRYAGAELLFEVISRAYEHHSLMPTTKLAFEEWMEVSPALCWTDSLTGATSWKPIEKATDRDRPGKYLSGNPPVPLLWTAPASLFLHLFDFGK